MYTNIVSYSYRKNHLSSKNHSRFESLPGTKIHPSGEVMVFFYGLDDLGYPLILGKPPI
jgi:hypothetical protein